MPEYREVQRRLTVGWNTFDAGSALSHVLLPEAFNIALAVKEYQSGAELRAPYFGAIAGTEVRVRPGARTCDGRFTSLTLTFRGASIDFKSARAGSDLVILVVPRLDLVLPPALLVEFGVLWGRPSYTRREGSHLLGKGATRAVEVHGTGKSIGEASASCKSPYLAFSLEAPVAISTGHARSLPEVMDLIDRAEAEMLAELGGSFGEESVSYEAMRAALGWNTIYDPASDRVLTTVSRRASSENGGWLLLACDTFLAAYVASLSDRDLAYACVVETLRQKTEQGFVPGSANAHGYKSRDRSHPPLGSAVVRELYRRFRERWLLELVFDDLLGWNRWWWRARRAGALLAWGSNGYPPVTGSEWEKASKGAGVRSGAVLESALADAAHYDDARFDPATGVFSREDVGLSSLYALDCQSLAELALIVGRSAEAQELLQRRAEVVAAMGCLWDEAAGMYLNRDSDSGALIPATSASNFYPLLVETLPAQRATRLLREQSGALSKLWAGPTIQPLPMLLVYLGLRRHGCAELCADFAARARALLVAGWLAEGCVADRYAPGGCAAGADTLHHAGAVLGLLPLLERGLAQGFERAL